MKRHWKGAKSSFDVKYPLFNSHTCLFFSNMTQQFFWVDFVKIGQNGELGPKW